MCVGRAAAEVGGPVVAGLEVRVREEEQELLELPFPEVVAEVLHRVGPHDGDILIGLRVALLSVLCSQGINFSLDVLCHLRPDLHAKHEFLWVQTS